jgi:hypothetical protein
MNNGQGHTILWKKEQENSHSLSPVWTPILPCPEEAMRRLWLRSVQQNSRI